VWRLSGGAAQLERVEVAVPRSWDFSRCAGQASPRGPRQTAYSRAARSPDILIGEDHPVYGDLPWSLQHRSHHLKINYVDTKAKCRHLKKLTCKGTLRQI
jgi:hypothetical protein